MNEGRAIRMLRASRHLEQQVIAKKAKIGQSYLSLVESGKRRPTLEVLERIVAAIGCKESEFFAIAADDSKWEDA